MPEKSILNSKGWGRKWLETSKQLHSSRDLLVDGSTINYEGCATQDRIRRVLFRAAGRSRIKELQRRVTDKAIERAALTKTWVMEKLRDNAEKALEVPEGSAVANRALELIGKELGMFHDDQPKKPMTMEDLSDEDLRKLLDSGSEQHADVSATEPGPVQ